MIKRQGPIWLGLTQRAVSIRPYDDIGEIAAMIARSAYAQLGYSPVLLAGTVLGLALVYLRAGCAGAVRHGLAQAGRRLAWAMMVLSFQPMLRFYRRSPLWGLALPLIGAFYAGFHAGLGASALRGRGGMWKGRVQAMADDKA